MTTRYKQQTDGEWVEPVQEGFKFQCCDCGMTHTMNFRIIEGVVQYQVFTDKRATGQVRRQRATKAAKAKK